MGFVKTPREIEQLQSILASPKALHGEMISLEFETTPAVIEGLLPPGLEPTGEAIGTVYLGRWDVSNAGPFAGGGVFVNARHGSLEGHYCVMFPVSTESAVLFGRDLMGEPKKLAEIEFERRGSGARASVSRLGHALIAMDVDRLQALPAAVTHASAFHYRYAHRVDGQGLESDPQLVCVETEFQLEQLEVGGATLKLTSSPLDPLGEIEVLRAGPGTWSRGSLRARPRVLGTVPAEEFLPYAFAKSDDWIALDNE